MGKFDYVETAFRLLQRQIAEQQVDVVAASRVPRFFRRQRRARHLPDSLLLQDEPVRYQNVGFIVHYENAILPMSSHSILSPPQYRQVRPQNIVPLPILLRTRNLPPWFSMIPFTIHSPSPVPRSPLVERRVRTCYAAGSGDAGPGIGDDDANHLLDPAPCGLIGAHPQHAALAHAVLRVHHQVRQHLAYLVGRTQSRRQECPSPFRSALRRDLVAARTTAACRPPRCSRRHCLPARYCDTGPASGGRCSPRARSPIAGSGKSDPPSGLI